jgi:uncharacterized membrane protein (UPF0127 family)
MADLETESKAREMMAQRYERSGSGGALGRVLAVLAILAVTLAAVFAFTQDDLKNKPAVAPKHSSHAPAAPPKKQLDTTEPAKDTPLVEYATVKVAGKEFKLELALNNEKRFRGLSGRSDIPAAGGMLFVFPDAGVTVQNFVMRDCPVNIDIIYLDRAARVTAFHKMKAEAPRSEAEKINSPPIDRLGKPHPEMPQWTWTNDAYENRLKKYSSKFASQYVIELKGDTLDTLKIKEGDKVELVGTTWDALKKQAQ